MHLPSLNYRLVQLDLKLFMKAKHYSYALDISNSGLPSTGLRSLRSASRYYNIPLRHTNLSSNRFCIRYARLWNPLPIDIISKGRLPINNHMNKHY